VANDAGGVGARPTTAISRDLQTVLRKVALT
jgi:hypothetical protein